MRLLTVAAAALRTLARWLAADREARRRTRRILVRWERTPRPPDHSARDAASAERPSGPSPPALPADVGDRRTPIGSTGRARLARSRG